MVFPRILPAQALILFLSRDGRLGGAQLGGAQLGAFRCIGDRRLVYDCLLILWNPRRAH